MEQTEKRKLCWYEIAYLYPYAFQKFSEKMFPNTGIVSNYSLIFFDQKNLYGFFDREGIYLNTEVIGSDVQWMYTIYTNGVTISNNDSGSCREDIEVNGFMKCFEFLERQLREKTTLLLE